MDAIHIRMMLPKNFIKTTGMTASFKNQSLEKQISQLAQNLLAKNSNQQSKCI
jgi:hypothetical protein